MVIETPGEGSSFVGSADPEELQPEDVAELGKVDPDPAHISYSGTDFDVAGLVRRHARGDIVVPTFGGSDSSIETAAFVPSAAEEVSE